MWSHFRCVVNSGIKLFLGFLSLLSQLLWTTLEFICLRFCHSYLLSHSLCSLVIMSFLICPTSIEWGFGKGNNTCICLTNRNPHFILMIYYVCIHILHCSKTILSLIYCLNMMLTRPLFFLTLTPFPFQPLYKVYCFLDWEPNFITKSLIFTLHFLFFHRHSFFPQPCSLPTPAFPVNVAFFSYIPISGRDKSQFCIFSIEVRIIWFYQLFPIPNSVAHQHLDYSHIGSQFSSLFIHHW